jgi:hypothetical protein
MVGVPCYSHVMHRAVLATIGLVECTGGIDKVVKLATAFKQSIPR